MLPRALAPALLLAVASLIPVSRLHAQALPTASKSIGFSVFGAVADLDPRYGPDHHNIGYVLGADVTRPYRHFDLSLEARVSDASGKYADERTYSAGLKVSRSFAYRFHPYVDFLAGKGYIFFDHPELISGPGSTYTQDDSTVYTFGGGLDYNAYRNFDLKIDAQDSSWKIGTEVSRFNPYNVSVGVVYHISFGRLRAHRN